MRRMTDQLLILIAIDEVRNELKRDMSLMEASEVMERLITLYSLLNVEKLRETIEETERKVA